MKMRLTFVCSNSVFRSPLVCLLVYIHENMYYDLWEKKLQWFLWPCFSGLPKSSCPGPQLEGDFDLLFLSAVLGLFRYTTKEGYNSVLSCSQLMESYSRALPDGLCKTFMAAVNLHENSQSEMRSSESSRGDLFSCLCLVVGVSCV